MANAAEPSPAGHTERRGVSVIIPCYNQAQFLPQTIESILAQSYRPVEIILVNDGSPDNTAEVAAQYSGRIKYIEQANQGLSGARNTGLRHATGEFLHFLDSDDYVRPGFYETLVTVLRAHPHAAAAYSGFQWVDMQGGFLGERPPTPEVTDWFHRLLEENPWPPCAPLVRASAFAPLKCFDARLSPCEDWDLWLRLAATGKPILPAANLIAVCYRKHPASMSNNPWTMLESGLKAITLNVRRHHNCPKCKVSAAKGRRYWRDVCFHEKVIPRIQPMLEQGGLGRYLRECFRALFYDPPSAWWGLKLLRHQKRRMLASIAGHN